MITNPKTVRLHTKQVTKELSDKGDPIFTAGVGAVLSVPLIVVSLVYMFLYPDARLAITTLQTFHDWEMLKQIIMDTTSYLPESNPVGLTHASFNPRLYVLEDYQDLVDRGLMSPERLKNSTIVPDNEWKTNPSLLQRLMTGSWCAYPNARLGSTPTTRNTGCACIASTYLDFVRETENMTSNVTLGMREKFAGRVLSCVDQRLVSKTDTCGRPCTVHPMGLMLYSNDVVFLVCVSYLMFASDQFNRIIAGCGGTSRLVLLKSFVAAIGLGLAFPYFLDDWRGNLLNVGGIVLAILNIVYSLHEDLMPRDMITQSTHVQPQGHGKDGQPLPVPSVAVHPMSKPGNPHPLVACIMVNLPLIIPAYTILLGLSGFGRDTWSVIVFGIVGGLLGLVLQAYTWTYWYADTSICGETIRILLCSFFCLVLHLGFMLLGYWDPYSHSAVGSVWSYIIFYFFVFVLGVIVNGEREDFLSLMSREGATPDNFFSLTFAFLLFILLGFNTVFTVLCAYDVSRVW